MGLAYFSPSECEVAHTSRGINGGSGGHQTPPPGAAGTLTRAQAAIVASSVLHCLVCRELILCGDDIVVPWRSPTGRPYRVRHVGCPGMTGWHRVYHCLKACYCRQLRARRRARAKSSAPAAAADFGRPGAMRVTAHPRAARTLTASVKNGIVTLAALVLAHDPAQAQQLDQERATARPASRLAPRSATPRGRRSAPRSTSGYIRLPGQRCRF
jgi:hypothetical protein